jgi:hypothetical protein
MAKPAPKWSLLPGSRQAAHRVIDGNLRVCDVARELGCPEFFGLRVLRLASGVHRGVEMEQWQYEVTSGGRLWYLVDTEKRTLWLRHAGPGHPSATD